MAGNNISFICERFFATTILKEFGAIETPSKTYKLISNYNKNILINSTVSYQAVSNQKLFSNHYS